MVTRITLWICLLLLLSSCSVAEPLPTNQVPQTTDQEITTTPLFTGTHLPRDTPTKTALPLPSVTIEPKTTEQIPSQVDDPTSIHPSSNQSIDLIAFTSDQEDYEGDIFVMNSDGSNLKRLTDNPAYDAWPSWSPDGSQIVFVSTRSGNPDLFIMDADGSNLRQLTENPANDIWPEWSPDGSQIVFPSRRDGNFELYLIHPDGTNLQRLTNTNGHEDFPTWSPDGSMILFSRIEEDVGTFIIDVDDVLEGAYQEQKLLDYRILEPAWSPDGTQIVFGSDHEGYRAIYIMDVDGGNIQKLSNTTAGENCPTWSPDGTQIAFASWRDGDGEIIIMEIARDEDGESGQSVPIISRILTDNRFDEEFPAWKPGSPTIRPDGAWDDGFVMMTYGGEQNDRAFDAVITEDDEIFIAGITNNTRLSHSVTPGNAWVVKTDLQGNLLWEKQYGGELYAYFNSIIQTGEQEFVLLGEIASSSGREETDIYLLKIDDQGNEEWAQIYGGKGMDYGKMVQQTADGGLIIVGDQADEFSSGNIYKSQLFLIRTDSKGKMLWSKKYGEKLFYLGWGVAQAPDGGFVLTGWEAKTIDDRDVIVIKTDPLGEVEWSQTWDLGERDGGFDMILTSDDNIVVACIQSMGSGTPSAVLIKMDLQGKEIWKKIIGEVGVGNTFWHILEDTDGGYIMAGDTHVGWVPDSRKDRHGGWMIKTDTEGEILWQHIYSEEEFDQVNFNSAVILPDGGYIFVGRIVMRGENFSDMLWLRVPDDQIQGQSD